MRQVIDCSAGCTNVADIIESKFTQSGQLVTLHYLVTLDNFNLDPVGNTSTWRYTLEKVEQNGNLFVNIKRIDFEICSDPTVQVIAWQVFRSDCTTLLASNLGPNQDVFSEVTGDPQIPCLPNIRLIRFDVSRFSGTPLCIEDFCIQFTLNRCVEPQCIRIGLFAGKISTSNFLSDCGCILGPLCSPCPTQAPIVTRGLPIFKK